MDRYLLQNQEKMMSTSLRKREGMAMRKRCGQKVTHDGVIGFTQKKSPIYH